MKSNLIKYFLFSLFILTAFSLLSCYLFKYTHTSLIKEVKSYHRWNSSLKLYHNNIFKIYTASDIIASIEHVSSSVTSRGEYKYIRDKLVLKYTKPAEYTDTLYYVAWGTRIFLMDKIGITFTANEFNLKYFTPDSYSYWGWYEDGNEGKSVFGLPLFPEPFNKYLIKDSLFADVIEINRDSARVTIDKGENDGLYYGCGLTDGENFFEVEYLYPVTAVLMPADIFLYYVYHKLIGDDFIESDSLKAMRIREGKSIAPEILYLPGCVQKK